MLSICKMRIFFSKKAILLSGCLIPIFLSQVVMAMDDKTPTGIPLDMEWKQKVYHFAQENVKHSAWGIAHSERNYQMSMTLAENEGIQVDKDIIFATAFLHDIGAIDPYKKEEMEHSVRSVEIVESLLASYGFPMQKWPKVKAAILGHMYYADRPTVEEAIIFHDADVLDFLGTIGIVRIVSITERHRWAQDLPGAFSTLYQFKNELTHSLITNAAKKIAEQRIVEMHESFNQLNQETFDGKVL